MRFQDGAHEKRYYELLSRMAYVDCYHKAVAYLMALRIMRPDDIFDFAEDVILHDGLHEPWQTHSSRSATRLAFNLWNSCMVDDERVDAPISPLYSIDYIFSNDEWAPYFHEAINIRFDRV